MSKRPVTQLVWFDDGGFPERRVRYDAAAGGDPLQSLGEEIREEPEPEPPKWRGPYRTAGK